MPSSRSLPSLDQFRRRAKQLHRAAKAADPLALEAFARYSKDVSLTSAQLVVARWQGFASWTRLKAAVEDPDPWPSRSARSKPPADELCAVIPSGTFLGQSARAKVGLTAIRVYSPGCALDIVWTMLRQGITDSLEVFRDVRYSVRFADGRAATKTERVPLLPAAEPSIVGSETHGTASGRDRWTRAAQVYICPLPPPGDLRFTFEWPAFGIPTRTTILDGAEIHAAAERVQRLIR